MIDRTIESPPGRGLAAALQGPWLATSWPAISVPILILAMVVLRCWAATRFDFETDEVYYWLWSRGLAAGYFDHPPMVAYLVRFGTALFGDTNLGIRCMAILAVTVASALVYALALILFDERRVALLATLWFTMTPHTTFFSVIMFPDTPALAFWLLTCVGVALVWRSGRSTWWCLAGVAMGLLLLSKYTAVFLAFGIAAWLVVSPDMRRWLKRPEPYLSGLIAMAMFSPVLVWNAEHGWASFAKQFGRALDSSSDGGLANVAAFVGEQAAFVSPLVFAFVVAGLAVAAARGLHRGGANWLLLALTSGPMLLYFLMHALTADVLAQWPSPLYAGGIVAAVAAFVTRAGAPPRHATVRYAFIAAPWLATVMSVGMLVQMALAPAPVRAANDPLRRFIGWNRLAADTRAVAQTRHVGYIATSNYDIDAVLAFHVRDVPVFQASEAIRYVSLPPIDQSLLARTTGLYVAAPDADDIARIKAHFDSVEPVATIWRGRNGDPIDPFRVYELKGYRGGLPY